MDGFKSNMPFGVDAVHTVTGRMNNCFYLVQTEGGKTDKTNLRHWRSSKITFHPTTPFLADFVRNFYSSNDENAKAGSNFQFNTCAKIVMRSFPLRQFKTHTIGS